MNYELSALKRSFNHVYRIFLQIKAGGHTGQSHGFFDASKGAHQGPGRHAE
jgi:hypothetical protein